MSQSTWEESVEWLRHQPDQQKLVRNCYYDDPLIEAAQRFTASTEWQAVLGLIPATPGKALDLGAGRGISSYALAVAGWEVVALEPDPSQLVGTGAIRSLAAQASLPITVYQSYGETMGFEDEIFDLVYAREVLHHSADLEQLCKQVWRVLRPGGIFLACREHVISRKDDLESFLADHPLHKFYGGENAFLLQRYTDAIKGSGLQLERVIGSYESPINYFPRRQEEIMDMLHAPLHRHLGTTITHLLTGSRWVWSRQVNKILAKIISRRANNPGRLVTFLAYKE